MSVQYKLSSCYTITSTSNGSDGDTMSPSSSSLYSTNGSHSSTVSIIGSPVPCTPVRENTGFVATGVLGGLLLMSIVVNIILIIIICTFIRKKNTQYVNTR